MCFYMGFKLWMCNWAALFHTICVCGIPGIFWDCWRVLNIHMSDSFPSWFWTSHQPMHLHIKFLVKCLSFTYAPCSRSSHFSHIQVPQHLFCITSSSELRCHIINKLQCPTTIYWKVPTQCPTHFAHAGAQTIRHTTHKRERLLSSR